MINTLNAVAVTLLVAVVSVFPAALIGQYVPGVFNPTLKPIAVAAWLSGLVCWWVSRNVTRKEMQRRHEQSQSSSGGHIVGITVAFLAIAIGIVVLLHFYGDRLIG